MFGNAQTVEFELFRTFFEPFLGPFCPALAMTEPIAISPEPSELAVNTPAARKSIKWGQSCTHNGLTMPLFAWVCLNFFAIPSLSQCVNYT